jgi:beta-glucosidase
MKRVPSALAAGMVGAAGLAFGVETPPAASSNVVSPDVEARVEGILSGLTVEEKCGLLGGVDDFYTRAVDRLGVKQIRFMDGPMGPRNAGATVAYPAGICLAATWNTELASREAGAIGRDALARGCDVLLGPAVNIYRVPTCGRNFEYFGEDPYLASRMAVAYVTALQNEGVGACIKHYAVNNQETYRWTVNTVVDERTLHEIYLPAFRAAVQEAGVWAVMSAYNRVNGPYCTANGYLQDEVLRKEWGFRGLVVSDWGATHETLNCMLGGLDLEMPAGEHLNADTIMPLLADGRVPASVLDEKVRRLLRLGVQTGSFDREQRPADAPLNTPEGEAAALEVARQGIVLLKNDGILPLDRSRKQRFVLIGQDLEHHGGGSAWTFPTRTTSLQEAMTAVVGENVEVIPMQPDLGEQLDAAIEQGTYLATEATGGRPALLAEYFSNLGLRGGPAVTRIEDRIDHDWGPGSPVEGVGPERFSVRWTGRIRPGKSGVHAFLVLGDDGFRVKLDGKEIGSEWRDQGATTRRYTARLDAGREYGLAVEYYNNTGLAEMRFGWLPAAEPFTPDQEEQLRSADAVIATVGFSGKEGEGSDRPYALPEDQGDMLQTAAGLNRRMIVVLNAGGGVEMGPFIDSCAALLHAFYPGQCGAQAVAEVLTGVVNPSGRLPITLERRWEDTPASGSFPGNAETTEYREGLFVGYRHYDRHGVEPRFPFGFGLSYTSFGMGNLRIVDDNPAAVRVAVDVTNTGKVAGAQVVQGYVSAAEPAVIRPVRQLKGFARVHLQPGETRTVSITLPGDAFARYDAASHRWTTDPGDYSVEVGEHSRKLDLKTVIRVGD